MERLCPACGASVPPPRLTCPTCKLNLHYAERVGIEAARLASERARPTTRENALAVARPLLGLGVVVALLVAAVIVIPVGPDAGSGEIESSVVEQLGKAGPPSSSAQGTTVSCRHPITNTRTFTCRGEIDVALLPDNDFTYKLQVYEEGEQVCWSGRGSSDDGPGDALLPALIGDCLD